MKVLLQNLNLLHGRVEGGWIPGKESQEKLFDVHSSIFLPKKEKEILPSLIIN